MPSCNPALNFSIYLSPVQAKVTDFGFARVVARNHVYTKTYGTVTHQPPELLEKGVLSFATDVFALGVLMWEVYMAQGVFKVGQ